MAVRKRLPLRSAVLRLVVIYLFLLSAYNPTPLSLVGILAAGLVPTTLAVLLVSGYLAVLLVLLRQAYHAVRFAGWPLVGLVGTAFVWAFADLTGPLWGTGAGVASGVLFLLAAATALGQVAAYWVRQASGQSAVLKDTALGDAPGPSTSRAVATAVERPRWRSSKLTATLTSPRPAPAAAAARPSSPRAASMLRSALEARAIGWPRRSRMIWPSHGSSPCARRWRRGTCRSGAASHPS